MSDYIIIMQEPEGGFRCNEVGCDWIEGDPLAHARDVHGVDDPVAVNIVHPDDH